jgi:uncharacterized membrane protein YraQ (UPF0718 family)
MRRYVSAERVNRWLQKYHRTSIIAATGVAVSTPLCSCGGGIAVALSMIAVSIPWGPLVAFITASPLTSPDELFYSAGLFGWPFALTYMAAAVIAGITGGVLAHALEKRGWLANQARSIPKVASTGGQPSCQEDTCCSQEEAPLAPSTRMVPTKRWPGLGYLTEIWLVGRRLLLTFVIASFLGYLLGNLLPARWISGLFGDGTGWSVPLGATLGLPFYLNISSSLPIARAFMAHGATPGAAMAFLLVGYGDLHRRGGRDAHHCSLAGRRAGHGDPLDDSSCRRFCLQSPAGGARVLRRHDWDARRSCPKQNRSQGIAGVSSHDHPFNAHTFHREPAAPATDHHQELPFSPSDSNNRPDGTTYPGASEKGLLHQGRLDLANVG